MKSNITTTLRKEEAIYQDRFHCGTFIHSFIKLFVEPLTGPIRQLMVTHGFRQEVTTGIPLGE